MSKAKIALITGASSGIGKELAHIHARRGGDVILVARRSDELNALKNALESSYNIQATIITKDLSVIGAAAELYAEVKKLGLEVDYLINNAGFGLVGTFHQLPLQRQQQMMHLNMIALTELTYLFLGDFVKRNSGKILNNSSTASLMPGPLQAVYFATKAYVASLSNALYEELRGTSISVTNLMPGATESEFGATSGMDKTPMFQKTAPTKGVALDGYEAMIRGDLDVISGLPLGGKTMLSLLKFIPKKMVLKQIKKMQEIK